MVLSATAVQPAVNYATDPAAVDAWLMSLPDQVRIRFQNRLTAIYRGLPPATQLAIQRSLIAKGVKPVISPTVDGMEQWGATAVALANVGASLFNAYQSGSLQKDIAEGAQNTSAQIAAAQAQANKEAALAMIEADFGADLAADVAREMVVYAKRPGGQAQHSALLALDAPRFADLNAWMRDHLGNDLSVESLAARAAMSPRTFARAYAAETGVTPAKAVERLRVEAARAALARGGSVQEIARRTGFGDPERMRRAFIRLYGTPPAALRRTLRPA